jgi:hypothetical protein
MQAMLLAVTPRLRTGVKLISESIRVDAPEGDLAILLGECQKAHPVVPMGSYPFVDPKGRYGTNLVLRSTDKARLEAAADDLRARLGAAHLGRPGQAWG